MSETFRVTDGASFIEAVESVSNQDSIILFNDIIVEEKVKLKRGITLDLNNFYLKSDVDDFLSISGENGSTIKNGQLVLYGSDPITIQRKGNVIFEDVNITTTDTVVVKDKGSKMTLMTSAIVAENLAVLVRNGSTCSLIDSEVKSDSDYAIEIKGSSSDGTVAELFVQGQTIINPEVKIEEGCKCTRIEPAVTKEPEPELDEPEQEQIVESKPEPEIEPEPAEEVVKPEPVKHVEKPVEPKIERNSVGFSKPVSVYLLPSTKSRYAKFAGAFTIICKQDDFYKVKWKRSGGGGWSTGYILASYIDK